MSILNPFYLFFKNAFVYQHAMKTLFNGNLWSVKHLMVLYWEAQY